MESKYCNPCLYPPDRYCCRRVARAETFCADFCRMDNSVIIGPEALPALAELLARPAVSRVFVLVDSNTARQCLPLLLPPGFCPCWLEATHARTDAGESHWSESAPQHPCHCHDDDPLAGLPANSDGSIPVEHDCCCMTIGDWDAMESVGAGMAVDEIAVDCDPPYLQNWHRCAQQCASPANCTLPFPSAPLYLLQCALLI